MTMIAMNGGEVKIKKSARESMIVWSPLLSNYFFNLSNGRYCSYWVRKSS